MHRSLVLQHKLEVGAYYVLRRIPDEVGVALATRLTDFVETTAKPEPKGFKPFE